jgi:hypothetical protein
MKILRALASSTDYHLKIQSGSDDGFFQTRARKVLTPRLRRSYADPPKLGDHAM